MVNVPAPIHEPYRVFAGIFRERTGYLEIKVIVAGPSDIMLAKHAERRLYDWLLRYNIKLFEYQAAFVYAKVAVCDSEWFTIGSYNIKNISAYASIESNADVHNPDFAAGVEQTLQNIIKQECAALTKEVHIKIKIFLYNLSAGALISLLESFFTCLLFILNKEDRRKICCNDFPK